MECGVLGEVDCVVCWMRWKCVECGVLGEVDVCGVWCVG